MMGKNITCECGEITGERCSWSGPVAETVIIEWMPPQHRESHEAAGNSGRWPTNGAIRLRVEKTCAERIVEADADWAEIVRA